MRIFVRDLHCYRFAIGVRTVAKYCGKLCFAEMCRRQHFSAGAWEWPLAGYRNGVCVGGEGGGDSELQVDLFTFQVSTPFLEPFLPPAFLATGFFAATTGFFSAVLGAMITDLSFLG